MLGSIGIGFIESLRVNQHVMYGVEQHFKNPCDGYFAELNFRKRMAKQEHMITSISELVGHFERLGAEARALDPEKNAETFVEFTPPPKETVKELCLRPNSLPSLIQGCHCWEFILEDQRRVSLYGRYDKEEVTAVKCRARMLCDAKCCDKEQATTPRLKITVPPKAAAPPAAEPSVDSAVAEAEVGSAADPSVGPVPMEEADPSHAAEPAVAPVPVPAEEEEEDQKDDHDQEDEAFRKKQEDEAFGNKILHFTTKFDRGWRTSYRKEEVEARVPAKFVHRLTRKKAAMDRFQTTLPLASRHRKSERSCNIAEDALGKQRAKKRKLALTLATRGRPIRRRRRREEEEEGEKEH